MVENKDSVKVNSSCVRLQVLTAASMKMTAFWDTPPCSLVEVDRHFSGAYCLNHLGDDGGSITHLRNVGLLHGSVSHKAVILVNSNCYWCEKLTSARGNILW
jgi:hypothetical protein